MARKFEFDLSTPCTGCGYSVQPAELLRVDGEPIRCPKCGVAFVPVSKPPWSQLGG